MSIVEADEPTIDELLDKLTPLQAKWATEYARTRNSLEAAQIAGYALSSAQTYCYQNRENPKVQEAVRAIRKRDAAELNITKESLVASSQIVYDAALEGNPLLDRYGKPTGAVTKAYSPALKALELQAELLGYKVDRKAVVTLDITKMNETELQDAEAQLEALLAKDATQVLPDKS